MRWLTLTWASIGLVVMFSASYAIAKVDDGDGLYYVKRQLAWIFIGLILFNWAVHTPLRRTLGAAQWFLLFFLALIVLTLVPGIGTNINGATRWLLIGPFALQPSELIKPFLVLQGACVFSQWHRLGWGSRGIWLCIFGMVIATVLLQPNLSTAALCGILLWLIALAAGLPYSQLIGTALSGLVAGVVSIGRNEYQLRRVLTFLDPWATAREDGYQLVQSLLAIGSGGTWGSGFGLSQQKLFYLPIQHTDFIFAVFAEEFGFVGSVLLLLFLASYATLGLTIAIRAPHNVYKLVAMGAIILLIGQSIINIGVATGVLPTTGLPLPMFSYGGNSMMASLLTAGLLVRVARETSVAEVVPLSSVVPTDS
jgi:cell division protein FtsW